MEFLGHIAVGLVAVLSVSWLLLRLPARISVALFALAAILMIPLNLFHPTIPDGWAAHTEPKIVFHIIKGVAVALGACIVLAYPLMRSTRQSLAVLIVALLGLNMLLAMGAEVRAGININILTGLLLILCMPSAKAVSVTGDTARGQMSYGVSWLWIVAYTLWDFAFIMQITDLGTWVVFGFVGLLSAIILTFGDPRRYLLARCVTLCVTMLIWQLNGVFTPLFASDVHYFQGPYLAFISTPALAMAVWLIYRSLSRMRRSGEAVTVLDVFLARTGLFGRDRPRPSTSSG